MIKLSWNAAEAEADIVRDGEIQTDAGFEAAVIISIFSDARALPDDDTAGMSKDPRGWWADTYADVEGSLIGSRLWLHRRRGITPQLLTLIHDDIAACLQWFIDDGIAKTINVSVSRFRANGIQFSVEIIKPDANATRWFEAWEVQLDGV